MLQIVWRLLVLTVAAAFMASVLRVPVTGHAAAASPVQTRTGAERRPPVSITENQTRGAYVEGELLVRYKKGTPSARVASLMAQQRVTPKRQLADGRTELIAVPPDQTVEEAMAELRASGLFEIVQPNYLYRADSVTDPFYPLQWGLENTGQTIGSEVGTPDVDIDWPEAAPLLDGLPEIVVAVIDSGLDLSHEDLAGQMWVNPGEIDGNNLDDDSNGYVDDIYGWNFWDNTPDIYMDPAEEEHGTHVAGTIAAAVNGKGAVGVAPNVRIMSLKVFGPSGVTTTDVLTEAVYYAANNGAALANASLGGTGEELLLRQAIAETGILLAAAAGNDASDNDTTPHYPASWDLPNIVSVASIDNVGGLSDFSNYGATSVDLAAPGSSILSTLPTAPERSDLPAAVLNDTGVYRSLYLGFDLYQVSDSDHPSLMTASLAALGYSPGDPISILLVNDAEVSSGLTALYQSALSTAGFNNVTAVSVTKDQDGPDLFTLSNYDLVIWFTGSAFGNEELAIGPVTTADQTALTSYLNGGGRLLLAGDDAIYMAEASPFVTGLLGVDLLGETGRFGAVVGVASTPFEAAAFTIENPLFGTSTWSDVVDAAAATAQVVLRYTDDLRPSLSYGYLSGTSMATPHVTGILAAALSQKNLTRSEAVGLLLATGKPLPSLSGKTVTGKSASLAGVLLTAVDEVTATISATARGEVAAYSFTFVTSDWGRMVKTPDRVDEIVIAFPPGFTLPAAIPADAVSVNGTPAGPSGAELTPVDGTVAIPIPSGIGPASEVTVSIAGSAGITTPVESGLYGIAVATSVDPVYVVGNPIAIGLSLTLDSASYYGHGAEDVTWDSGSGFTDQKAQVLLEDTRSDLDPTTVDGVLATVTSDSDPTGIAIMLEETGPDTGIFRGSFGFAGESNELDGAIGVGTDGETVSVTANGLAAAATWRAPAESAQSALLFGDLTYDHGAIDPADVGAGLLSVSGGAMIGAGAVETAGWAEGTGRYGLLVPSEMTGEYVLVVRAPGYSARTGVITLPGATDTLVTLFNETQAIDVYALPQSALALEADTVAPQAPTVAGLTDSAVLQEESVAVDVTTEPYALVSVQVDGGAPESTWVGGDGVVTVELANLVDGNHTLALTATDLAGNESAPATIAFGVDTMPLSLTVEPVHAAMTAVVGTTKPGAGVEVLAGTTLLGSNTAALNDSFSVTIPAQPAGTVLTVKAQDSAGREESASLTVWPVPKPELASLTLSPGNLSFNPGVTEYAVTVSASTLTVSANPGNPWVGVSINGVPGTSQIVNLSYGSNVVTVTASLAPDQETVYTINITRQNPTPPPPPPPPPGNTPPPLPPVVTPPVETPPPAVEPPPRPGTLEVTSDHVDAASPGELLQITLPGSTDPAQPTGGTVVLPSAVLATLADKENGLTIQAAGVSLQVDAETLKQAAGAGSLTLSVSVVEPGAAQTELPAPVANAMGDAPGKGLTSAGPVVVITVTSTDAEGNEVNVTQLTGTWSFTVPYDPSMDPDGLAVYWFNPTTSAWEFVGGRVDPANHLLEVELDHFSEFAVFAYNHAFADLPADHWAHGVVQALAARGIVTGQTESTFGPSALVTRAEFAALLARALNLPAAGDAAPSFHDVQPTDWFYDSVERAAAAGLIIGQDQLFRPNDPITRQEMAVMIIRAVGLTGELVTLSKAETEATLSTYADSALVGSWASEQVALAARLNLIAGRSTREYAPTAHATRAEAAMVLHRALQRLGAL